MKCALLILALCVAYSVAAPRQKRIVLGELAAEAAKILVCQGKMTEEDCMACCHSSEWVFSLEENACTAACNVLPNASDYLTTYKPANLINNDTP